MLVGTKNCFLLRERAIAGSFSDGLTFFKWLSKRWQRETHWHSMVRGSIINLQARRRCGSYFGFRLTTSARGDEKLVWRIAAEAGGATFLVCAYIDQQKKENLDWNAFRI